MHDSAIIGIPDIIPDVDDTADVPTHLGGVVNGLEKYAVIPCPAAGRPGSPHEGMTIFETDTERLMMYRTASPAGWYPPWNLPWGRIAYAQRAITQTLIGSTNTDLTGLTMTVTAVAGRRYRISSKVNINVTTQNGGYPNVTLAEDGVEIMQDQFGPATGSLTNPTFTFHTEMYSEPGAGSVIWKMQASSGASGQVVQALSGASRPNWIAVEDIGPIL